MTPRPIAMAYAMCSAPSTVMCRTTLFRIAFRMRKKSTQYRLNPRKVRRASFRRSRSDSLRPLNSAMRRWFAMTEGRICARIWRERYGTYSDLIVSLFRPPPSIPAVRAVRVIVAEADGSIKRRGSVDPRRRKEISSPAFGTADMETDCVVVGAGFAGAVCAERLANTHGKRVLVVERRG